MHAACCITLHATHSVPCAVYGFAMRLGANSGCLTGQGVLKNRAQAHVLGFTRGTDARSRKRCQSPRNGDVSPGSHGPSCPRLPGTRDPSPPSPPGQQQIPGPRLGLQSPRPPGHPTCTNICPKKTTNRKYHRKPGPGARGKREQERVS